ncbi:MAG: NAD+ synthase [Candidatus Sumerlaeaceae bacterium]
MKIALCQLNTITGNIAYNTRRIVEELTAAAANGAQLAIFPELAIPGYPPKDLLEYKGFIHEADAALDQVRGACTHHGIDTMVGTVHRNVFGGKKPLLNSAALITSKGDVRFTFKKLLPTYDVFDEDRYFRPCPPDVIPPIAEYVLHRKTTRIGASVCEDIWNDNEFWKDERLYDTDPIQALSRLEVDMIVNISASPFVSGKPLRRVEMLRHTAKRWGRPVILVNQVGGCDQVIFDGGSCVVLPDGSVPCAAGWFEEKTVIWDTANSATHIDFEQSAMDMTDEAAGIARALQLGLRDYLSKTGFTQVVVGSSGGIDSAVVLALAVDALGAENVISVSMPGPYTSADTRSDSATLAKGLGIRHVEVPIQAPFEAFTKELGAEGSAVIQGIFEGDDKMVCPIANENLQSRIRGTVLMWISNAIVAPRTLVLSTGNKSEMAAGYCTLYGDMAGGLALISDVPKMMVYKLARHMNVRMGGPIPQSIIDREPTAELAPNQKDSDSLPAYPVLDAIVRLFVEERQTADEIVTSGAAPEAIVRRVVRMIELAEYKRAQAAPGLKVTSKAFGFGRRMPIARGQEN